MNLPDKEIIIEKIHNFWFGAKDNPNYGKARPEWFTKNDDFDNEIRVNFEKWVEAAGKGELDFLLENGEGAVAFFILLDQFPRNIFRGGPKSFSFDAKALLHAKEVVAQGIDQKVPSFMRSFIYLPFEHSENLEDQEKALELFAKLDDGGNGLIWAKKHHVIIEKFGRFPHRNEILGRQSTKEEIEFLQGPDSSF